MKLAEIPFDKLKEMAKKINQAVYDEDGEKKKFLEKPIKTIGVSKETLATEFAKAVEGMADELIELFSKDYQEIAVFYNDNDFLPEVASTEKKTETTEKKKEEKAAPKEKEKKSAPKADKPPKETKKAELSIYGHKIGSQAAVIDDLISSGKSISLEELSKKSGRSVLGVKSHIKHLGEARGLTIEEKEGSYRLIKAK